MRIRFFLLLGLVNFLALFAEETMKNENQEEEIPFPIDDDGVHILTNRNYEKFLDENPNTLVEFYAPWCGHCKQLAPHYASAAKILKEKKAKGVLAKLDATKESLLAQKFDVKGYPTLKLFKNGLAGSIVEYDGDRDADGIVQWFQEKTDPDYKPPPSSVLTLTSSNFNDVALTANLILVEFYAPWCGHCKKLAPEYEKAALKLSRLEPPIPLAKVDATVEKDLAEKYQVKGYPTLKLFRKGQLYEYTGPRTSEGIVEHMIEKAKPAAREIKTTDEIKRFISQDDINVVGFFDEKDNEELLKSFKQACETLREDFKNLYFTYDKSVMLHLKGQYGRIGIFYPERFWSKYEPKSVFYDKVDAKPEQIVNFVKDKCTPLVGHRTPENQDKRYTKRPLVVAYFTVDFGHAHRDGTQYWRQKVLNVAHDFPAYTFAISDEEAYAGELESAGLSDSGFDVNIIVYTENKRRYPMSPDEYDEFSEENLRRFMKRMNEGLIKPHIKSQPLPKDVKGPVRVLVGSNFDKVVQDDSKDVLIEFYAPWCGHCKSLEPIYNELAEKFKSDKKLIIAKFDATANDIPDKYEVEGFPTIYFAPSGRKNDPMKYDGDRTLSDLTKFIKQNAVASFKKEEL